MDIVEVPPLDICVEILDFHNGAKLHSECKSMEFRSAKSLYAQIIFIKKIIPTIDIRSICGIMEISTRRYYHAIKSDLRCNNDVVPPNKSLLTEIEEASIISQIHIAQLNNECLTGVEIRKIASDIYYSRTGICRDFTRKWCFSFRQRYQDMITKIKAACLDDDRSSIDIKEVERYINEIEEMMKDPPNPYLLINFDETGFGKRPEKGKRKNVYIYRNCSETPYWRETKDQHHITLVAGISAACTSIRPMLISTRKKLDDDLEKTFFFKWGSYAYTSKGYMTQEVLIQWIENNLAPYVYSIRQCIHGANKCVVIADGCTSHYGNEIKDALEKIGNIRIIYLPPHSSHISQMLDASLFSALKRKYSSITKDNSLISKFTQKMMKIKKAYQTLVTEELIKSSWETTGLKLEINNDIVVKYEFSNDFKVKLRNEASHTEFNQ